MCKVPEIEDKVSLITPTWLSIAWFMPLLSAFAHAVSLNWVLLSLLIHWEYLHLFQNLDQIVSH